MARPFSSTSMTAASSQPESPRQIIFPVEVVDVMLSKNHPEFPGNITTMIGSIKGRRYDSERGTPIADLSWYNPLDPRDLKIPLIGEAVLLVESPNRDIVKSKKSMAFCYISPVGFLGGISNNALPGVNSSVSAAGGPTTFTGNMGPKEETPIGDYVPEAYIPSLVAFEGDRIIQGRWGNAIRFSNTSFGSEDKSFWNTSGPDGDPITIISNGLEESGNLMRSEDLNDGSSNIILSSTQELDLEASNKLPPGYSELNQYASSQIVLSSDKIVLNSMEDNVVISGKKGVSISTPEWKADITDICDILLTVVTEFTAFTDGSKPAVTGVGPTGPTTSAYNMKQILTKIKSLQQ